MRVLVIAPHPDDETLGSGGTLLKSRRNGDNLFWMIVTQAHEPQWQKDLIRRKAIEVEKVAARYGMQQHFRLGFPTLRLTEVPLSELIESIRKVIAEIRPEVVYLPHKRDIHTDHQVVFTAAMSVMKPFYSQRFGVRRLLCYETLSSTEAAPPESSGGFAPNVFIDVSDEIEQKIEIMKIYESEIQPDPLPRGVSAIRALARFRGATIGVDYAEAFMLVREIM